MYTFEAAFGILNVSANIYDCAMWILYLFTFYIIYLNFLLFTHFFIFITIFFYFLILFFVIFSKANNNSYRFHSFGYSRWSTTHLLCKLCKFLQFFIFNFLLSNGRCFACIFAFTYICIHVYILEPTYLFLHE